MGTGDDGVVATAEKKLSQCFWERDVVQAAVEHFFDFGVASGDGISDDDEVCAFGKVGGGVAPSDGYPFALKESTHRRVHVLIGPGDGETLVSHGGGHGAHGSSADSDKVDVLDGFHPVTLP